MRLDKYLSNSGYTRSEAVKLIAKKKVFVSGVLITKKDFNIDENNDVVVVDGQNSVYKPNYYFMLNKPAGVITANFDKNEQTIFDILPEKLKKLGLFAVGRLDKETEGLLILTTDGELCHKLTSPKFEKEKQYYFELADVLSTADKQKIESGLTLKNGETTKPCKINVQTSKTGVITISEGKYHQVRRMFASVKNKVIYLKRISENGIDLPNDLKIGQIVELNEEQIKILTN